MKILEREETIKKVYGYEAKDGTFFKNEDECKKYEEGALCVAAMAADNFKINKQSGWTYHDDCLPIGYEDDLVVYEIRSAYDLQVLNTYIELANKFGHANKVAGPDCIGKKVCVTFYDGDSAVFIGTKAEMKKKLDKYLDNLFGEEPQEEKTSNSENEDEDDEWFGRVRWHRQDVESRIFEMGYESSPENVSKVCDSLKNGHYLEDCMVERGWDCIENVISDLLEE